MRTLVFEVRNQKLDRSVDCDFKEIVSGTEGYLQAQFIFYGDAWKKCKIAASFWVGEDEHAVLLDKNGVCMIPIAALMNKYFRVSLTGVKTDYKITTNKVKIKQEVF